MEGTFQKSSTVLRNEKKHYYDERKRWKRPVVEPGIYSEEGVSITFSQPLSLEILHKIKSVAPLEPTNEENVVCQVLPLLLWLLNLFLDCRIEFYKR